MVVEFLEPAVAELCACSADTGIGFPAFRDVTANLSQSPKYTHFLPASRFCSMVSTHTSNYRSFLMLDLAESQ